MLSINITKSEELQGTVKKFISSLLPHKYYNPDYYLVNLQTVFKYIHLDEFELEYYLIFRALDKFKSLKLNYENYIPKVTRRVFEELLEVSIYDAVSRPELGVKEWLEYEGLDANLQNEVIRADACQRLCTRALELYEECFSMEIASEEALSYELELRAAFESWISLQALNTQAEIIRSKVRIGRKWYSGFEDWQIYTSTAMNEISLRLSDANADNTIVLDSYENSRKALANLKEDYEPIAQWGIPELDDYTPILKHRYVVVVANENIGKTHFLIDKAANTILANKKVVYMCGESTKANIYQMILKNIIWKKYGFIVETRHLISPHECPPDIEKIITMTMLDIADKGGLILQDSFSYATVGSELEDLYSRYHFDVVMIDHSYALRGTVGDGSLKAKGDELSRQLLQFKKAHPVSVIVASHMSYTAKNLVSRGKDVTTSSTKGSSDFGNDADEVFRLEADTLLQKQNLLKLIVTKRRGPKTANPFIMLITKFEVSAFIYDENRQSKEAMLSVQKAAALTAIDEDLNEAGFDL